MYPISVNPCLIRAGELFRTAVKMQAVAIVIAHNHPGGDPTPSPDDVRVTENIVAAGKLLNIGRHPCIIPTGRA